MFLKKVLNQPNLVGTVMIALLIGSGFVYAVAFDGFNVETATGSEVEAWLAAAGDSSSSGSSREQPVQAVYTCDNDACAGNGNPGEQYSECPARHQLPNLDPEKTDCTGCSRVTNYCKKGCSKGHTKCHTTKGCPHANKKYGGCSNARNSKTGNSQTTCP